MMEMIMAIALWCGTPNYRIGEVRTQPQVQECRDRLMKCLTKNEQKCFEQEKLK